MSSIYQIELRPHIGLCAKEGELLEVEHDQWIVVAARNGLNPRQVGYLSKRADAVLAPLAQTVERMGPFLYGEMLKAVEAARDAKFSKEPASE